MCTAADVGTVEVAAVQTPGRKERSKILKKRKALFDVATVVPNMYVLIFYNVGITALQHIHKTCGS